MIKTATQKSIIEKIEREFKAKQDLLKEDRKVLEWSSHDGGGGATDHEQSFVTDQTPLEI